LQRATTIYRAMQLRANGDCVLLEAALSPAFSTKYCEDGIVRFGAVDC